MVLKNFLADKLEKAAGILTGQEKQNAEVRFWREEIQRYVKWYNGEIKELYGHSLTESERVVAYNPEISAILSFFNIHQKRKYLSDLLLEKNSFSGMKLLDVGSGPFPSALCFENCEVYSLDPLLDRYLSAGFPVHCYEQRGRFVQARAESMPFEDGFFDAVISVNAIDHVDDFGKTAQEIKRVLKPGGRFRMHVHYHLKTKTEPIELNDDIFLNNYSWVTELKKIGESREKLGTALADPSEKFVVWGNYVSEK